MSFSSQARDKLTSRPPMHMACERYPVPFYLFRILSDSVPRTMNPAMMPTPGTIQKLRSWRTSSGLLMPKRRTMDSGSSQCAGRGAGA